MLCMLNVTLDMLHKQWIAGIIWMVIGLVLVINALCGYLITTQMEPAPRKRSVMFSDKQDTTPLLGADDQSQEDNVSYQAGYNSKSPYKPKSVSPYTTMWQPGTSEGAPVAARAQVNYI